MVLRTGTTKSEEG